MPPRRSTRPTRASVEPDSAPAPAPKRKRTSAADENGDGIKPPSRSRKSATPAPPKAAPASRRKSSLREIQESDEEEEAPPVKRTKSSPDDEDVEEASEEEEEDEAPRKGRRAPAKKTAAPAAKSRRRPTVEDVTDEDAPARPPAKTGRRVPGSKPPSAARTTKPTAQSKSVKAELDGDGEPVPAALPSKARRAPAKPPSKRSTGRRSAIAEPAEETVEEVEEEEEVPPPAAQPLANASDDSEDDEADEVAANLTREMDAASDDEKPAAKPSPSKQRAPAVEEEEEEEHSLLDPPNVPLSQARTQPPPLEEPTGPRSRLVIHKMALINFKSYAGRQEIGPFHKSFSAIVGPNGSGKSNTIDALLFVFGYRAAKMRQGKLSELIHNSASYEDLDFCTVEVHFREILDLPGPDAYEIVPGSNLVVARTAYQNNSSKYTINGSASSFTEVTTLLKSRGIDLDHKRFLILQGEVESIALMKPKAQTEHEDGLLEYLEDIIGTNVYKEPIDQALVEMDRLGEERGEKMNRLRITEREKNMLEDQKRDAENYLRLQNEHARAQSRMWQYYLWKCFQTAEEYKNRHTSIDDELTAERERNKDDIEHLAAMERHFAERERAYEEVKAAAAAAVKELAEHERTEIGLGERVKHAKTKAKKLKKALDEDGKAQNEAARAIEGNTQKAERERSKAEQHEQDLDREEKELSKIQESLKDKTQVFHDQIEAKQKELQPWTTKINQKQSQINIAQSERDTLVKKAEQAQAATEEAKEALSQLQADQATKDDELAQKTQEKAEAANEYKKAKATLAALRARVDELRQRATSKRQRTEEAKASQTQASSQGRVLDSLVALRQRNGVQGFHGRLGSLGTIDDKYDVAISTACPTLHHMLVEKVEQAQQCIEHLRRHNVGRASFMVLEKMEKNAGQQRVQTPENAPRLFDLIKPNDAKFAPAFYKAVRDTLVAENLEQANRIAFGGSRRWRVVTLTGQLIDTSGTMAGGGSSTSRGAMSSKRVTDAVSPETIREYQDESDKAAQDLDAAIGQLRVAENDIERFNNFGPALDTAIDKINMEISNGQRRITEATKRLRDLQAQSKPDSGDVTRIKKLERDVESLTSELKSLEQKSEHINEAIKALEKKILDIGGSRLMAQKSKVDGIRQYISIANDEVTKAEVAVTKAEKDVAKLVNSIKKHNAELEEVEGDLAKLNDELTECNQYVESLRQTVEGAREAEENSKGVYDKLKADLRDKTEAVQEFRKIEADLERSLKEVEHEMAQNDKAIDHYQAQHDKLKLEDVDSDDEDEEQVEDHPESTADGEEPIVKTEEGEEKPTKRKAPRHSAPLELKIYETAELAQFNKRNLVADVALLDEQMQGANPNLGVLKEYRKREEEYLRRAKDLEETTGQRDAQKQKYDSLRQQRLDEFMAGFNSISLKLKEMYQMITLGGNAELELVDSMDPFSEGIIFSVMPPKKSWKNISNLSGGEKTLSSLALVFALHHFKPTPLYFMDEIDAALDFRNVSIVANYIKDRTKNAQFIIISLRNDMFELSHRLIGIYKTANTTKSVSINNHVLTAAPANAARASRVAA